MFSSTAVFCTLCWCASVRYWRAQCWSAGCWRFTWPCIQSLDACTHTALIHIIPLLLFYTKHERMLPPMIKSLVVFRFSSCFLHLVWSHSWARAMPPAVSCILLLLFFLCSSLRKSRKWEAWPKLWQREFLNYALRNVQRESRLASIQVLIDPHTHKRLIVRDVQGLHVNAFQAL